MIEFNIFMLYIMLNEINGNVSDLVNLKLLVYDFLFMFYNIFCCLLLFKSVVNFFKIIN